MNQITRQMMAQGSYGLYRINRRNGQRIGGDVITVWHAYRDGKEVGHFLTRDEARKALAAPEYTPEDALANWDENG